MCEERLRLMVKVCKLYYQSAYNQQEIAQKLGISRSKVSRLLSGSREEGIVEIKVRNPFLNESIMEDKMKQSFTLKHSVVVDTADFSQKLAHDSLGRVGSDYFENIINKDDMIGVMAGDSVASLVREMNERNQPLTRVIPLIGGWNVQGMSEYANKIAIELANKVNGEHFLLHAPAIVHSTEVQESLLKEPSVKKVINQSRNANVALVGIGEISKDATFVKSMNLSNNEIKEIIGKGAVSSIGTAFINNSGDQVAQSFSKRMIGISGEELKAIPLVIGIASGLEKVDAIIASLNGRWIDALITDADTAAYILKHKDK